MQPQICKLMNLSSDRRNWQSPVTQLSAKSKSLFWRCFNLLLHSIILTLLSPSSLFVPFKTRGADLPSSFFPFPELLEGVTCSKMGLQLSSCKNLQLKTQFWCLSHFLRYSCLKKKFFPYISALRGNFSTTRNGPPYENKAFLTNSVIPGPNRKFFDHGKWFLMYLTYIKEYTKMIRISTH